MEIFSTYSVVSTSDPPWEMGDDDGTGGLLSQNEEKRRGEGEGCDHAVAEMLRGMEALPGKVATTTCEQLEQRMNRMEDAVTSL